MGVVAHNWHLPIWPNCHGVLHGVYDVCVRGESHTRHIHSTDCWLGPRRNIMLCSAIAHIYHNIASIISSLPSYSCCAHTHTHTRELILPTCASIHIPQTHERASRTHHHRAAHTSFAPIAGYCDGILYTILIGVSDFSVELSSRNVCISQYIRQTQTQTYSLPSPPQHSVCGDNARR